MKKAGVYRIHCVETKRNYIGSSSRDWRNRINGHRHLLNNGKHSSKAMQADWDKYGASKFFFVPVCECNSDCVLEMEHAAAIEWKAFDKERGYNTNPIAGNRFRGGRPSKDGCIEIRFSRKVSPERAKAISNILQFGEEQLISLEHVRVKGWKIGDRVVGFNHANTDDEIIARFKDKAEDAVCMATQYTNQISALKTTIALLEKKIAEYEQMYG